MKVLWFTNITFPEFSDSINITSSYSGGWMIQFKTYISKIFDLYICSFENEIENVIKKRIDGVEYILIPKKQKKLEKIDKTIIPYINEVFENINPDLVHIWGTEYLHTYIISNICNEKNINYVISIQGLISDCAKHYFQGIPMKNIYYSTLRDLIRYDNILNQKKKFEKRGYFEIETLKKCKNVIGRTIYDYSGVKEINKNINYFFCNECLRTPFYDGKWNLDNVERKTIFISQASYPIKGFHYFLDALSIVKKSCPEIKVIVAGGFNPFKNNLYEKIRLTSYESYIAKKIIFLNLKENISFIGNLSDIEMKNQLLKANAFVSASLVENSPNSIGEAMLIGTPIISSFVGGVGNFLTHKVTGLLYPSDQPNILATYILNIINDDNLAKNLSYNARKKSLEIYDIQHNTKQLEEIYFRILNENER